MLPDETETIVFTKQKNFFLKEKRIFLTFSIGGSRGFSVKDINIHRHRSFTLYFKY